MLDNTITPAETVALVGDFQAALGRFMAQYRELQVENASLRECLVDVCEEGQTLIDLVGVFSARLPENVHAAADALEATIDALTMNKGEMPCL